MHAVHKKGHGRSPALRLHDQILDGLEMLELGLCSSKYISSACLEITLTLRIIIICAF